jgi:endoribonuclease LACTB2
VGEPSVDALYEQVRTLVPTADDGVAPSLVAVAPGIRVLALRTPTLPPAAHTNTYVVGPDAGPCVVVDPGSPYPDQQAILVEALDKVDIAAVLLTHHHGDHIGGAEAFAQARNVPIAAHHRTIERLAGVVPIGRELRDGDAIEADIACVYTPGHADGHLVFERDGVQIAGDMVAGVGTILIDPSEGDMADYLASLALMLSRAPKTLLPAHGPAITDAAGKLREYIAHRTMREDRVVAALRDNGALGELLSVVYADTPRMLWPLAERSLRAHLDKLVKERRAEEVESGRWTLRDPSL